MERPGSGEHRGSVVCNQAARALKALAMFSSPAVRPGTREVTVPLGVVCFADAENMQVSCVFIWRSELESLPNEHTPPRCFSDIRWWFHF